ncbi:MAG: SRPBCC domain-containing protein [Flavobacteriales bacterium]|nr:SRPBCC domain-containing protein [Flavobacteriales bacterium]
MATKKKPAKAHARKGRGTPKRKPAVKKKSVAQKKAPVKKKAVVKKKAPVKKKAAPKKKAAAKKKVVVKKKAVQKAPVRKKVSPKKKKAALLKVVPKKAAGKAATKPAPTKARLVVVKEAVTKAAPKPVAKPSPAKLAAVKPALAPPPAPEQPKPATAVPKAPFGKSPAPPPKPKPVVQAVMMGADPLGGPAPVLKRPLKERFTLEFPLRSAPGVLFEAISSPSGLSEWFCDDVDPRGEEFTFHWGDDEQTAQVIGHRHGELIRMRWMDDEDPGAYFELRIRIDPMTNDVVLVVTDHAWPAEMEKARQLWEAQVGNLQRVLGA